MPNRNIDRRHFLTTAAGAGLGLSAVGTSALGDDKPKRSSKRPWPLCLNTSTIRPASLEQKVQVAKETGWDAIELWMNDLEEYEKQGGDLKALGEDISDSGLFVPNVIGLWNSMPATEEEFKKSLDGTRNRMRIAADVGAQHVAALPTPDRSDIDLAWCTHCYRELLKIGKSDYGIIPAIEFVGFFKGVFRLGQACAIAFDTDDPDACLIADTFHIFRGGSGFNGIKHLNGSFIADFHWNDASDDVPREQQGDQHRLLPGDGTLPLKSLLKDLKAIGYTGPLSLELFHRELWKKDPKQVAQEGLNRMLECIGERGMK